MIVGLTGGIGSGKSAASAVFEHLGIGCVDADQVAREVVEPGQPALASIGQHFGPEVLTEEGRLNRKVLRDRIFKSADEKAWLEALLHPLIRDEMQRQLTAVTSPYAVLVAPLLFENQLDRRCHTTLLIDVPESVQIDRILCRDGGTRAQAEAIIRAQMPREEKRRRAEHIVSNTGSLDDLEAALVALHRKFVAQSAS